MAVLLILTFFVLTSMSLGDERRAEEALSQFERDYVLLKGGQFEFEENFTYTYYSANQIFLESFAILDPVFLTLGQFGIESAKRNIFVNTFLLRAGVTDFLQLELSLPFVYRYDTVSVIGSGETKRDERSMERAGIGDVAVGISVQPIKETARRPALILNIGYKSKTGKSPFDIDPEKDVPTGTGYASVRAGFNLVKSIDPVVVYGGLGYIYNLPEKVNKQVSANVDTDAEIETGFLKKVYPGDTINLNVGMAYALSYMFSMSAQFIESYTLSTYVETDEGKKRVKNSALNSALFKFGAGMSITKNVPLSFSIYMGLTEDAPDYIVELRVPVKF
ncbi:transporter [Hydrogenivirga sp.]